MGKNEYTKKIIKRIMALLWVVVATLFVINGHKVPGVQGLSTQMVGLVMLLIALYLYNKPYSK